MQKKKIIVDIFMIILLLLIINIDFTGALIHEVLGITIWILFMIHLFFNYKWIKAITKKILTNDIKTKIKLGYTINLLLFIFFFIITLSGIAISKELFYYLDFGNYQLWYEVHKIVTYLAIFLLIVHIILHFSFFEQQLRNIFKNIENKESVKSLTAISIIFIIVLLVYNLFSTEIKEVIFNTNKDTNNTTTITDESNNVDEDTVTDDDSMTDDDTTEDDDDDTVTDDDETDSGSTTTTEVSLTDYLSKLFCTGCGRHCPLISPQCGRGEQQAQVATQEYEEMY